ncbi:diguanylate cyclase domain-containing protein [Lysinibacillus antri]|nr:diguanylate cyclase [Lysinibacillus antri]
MPFVFLEKQQRREDARNDLEKMIDVQQVTIDIWLSDRVQNIRSLAELPTMKSLNLSDSSNIFQSFDEYHSEFEGIVYVNKNGITELDTSGEVGVNVSDRQYFKEAKNGNAFITDVIIGRQSKKPVIVISVPVFDRAQQFQGLVFGAVSINTINDILKQFQDKNRETYLVNRDGMIITESRQGKLGETIDSELFNYALAGKKLDDFYDSTTGEKVLGNYKWAHNNQWLVIGEISKNTIYESFYRMAFIFVSVILLLALLGYVFMIFVSKQIEEPIQRVLDGTKKIGKGNWGYRLSSPTYKDEIKELQELSHNFNQMAETIESHIYSIAENEERFRTIMQYSSDMITIHDANGKYLYVSPAGKEILQYEDHEILGYDSYYFIHPEDIPLIEKNFEKLLQNGYVVSTYRIRKKNNDYIWFESSIKYMKGNNEDASRIFTVSRNITERKMVEQQLTEANKLLQELSSKDGLTGILNRRSFDERLEEEWKRAERNNLPLSLIMLDIDFFKAYNDTYGHLGGDDCLREVANAISQACKRESDSVFRYGGEEFGIILPETDLKGAQTVAEKARKTVENLQISHAGSKISDVVTISLGVATIIPTKYASASSLIESADKALYQAKQEGRNQVRSYYKE